MGWGVLTKAQCIAKISLGLTLFGIAWKQLMEIMGVSKSPRPHQNWEQINYSVQKRRFGGPCGSPQDRGQKERGAGEGKQWDRQRLPGGSQRKPWEREGCRKVL